MSGWRFGLRGLAETLRIIKIASSYSGICVSIWSPFVERKQLFLEIKLSEGEKNIYMEIQTIIQSVRRMQILFYLFFFLDELKYAFKQASLAMAVISIGCALSEEIKMWKQLP